jgi:NADH-quinone oxidoreductase subunit F
METHSVLPPGGVPVASLRDYEEAGGLQGWKLAQEMDPQQVVRVVRASGLRGRGGAGFATAAKWDGVRNDPGTRKYLVCNGAEGEPGTFKDRYLLRLNPYQTLEGVLIARYAIGAERAYVCTKQQFTLERERLETALAELKTADVVDSDLIELVFEPDEYLFGEEKALLEVIEGGLPLPRVFPPYIHGLFGAPYGGPSRTGHNPTVVNNVETLANVPSIIRHGATWIRSAGTRGSPGTMVFTLSGDVRVPGIYELPLGTTLRTLIEEVGGGVASGRQVQAVFPGLAAAPLRADELNTGLDFDAMRAAGSALGSGGFIVYDDTACLAQAALNFSNFLYVESCDQCSPCKLGADQITSDLRRLLSGAGTQHDIQDIADVCTWTEEGQRCFLASSEALVMAGLVDKFPRVFQAHLQGTCRQRHDLPLPKIVDYSASGGFIYDEHYVHKQQDWTYDDQPRVPEVDEGALHPER